MTTRALVLCAALLTGCASTFVPYTPGKAPSAPQKLVERILLEEAIDIPSGSVRVSGDYFEVLSTRASWTTRHETSPREVVRVYYRSIDTLTLYRAGSRWYVVSRAADGREMAGIQISNGADAKQFIDALEALRKQADTAQ